MPANDNVTVRIVGDASGVAPATQVAKGEVEGLAETVKALSASMQAMSAQMSAAMAKFAESTQVARAEVRAMHEETTTGFTAMIGKIHEGAESVRTFQMRAKEFAELYVGLFAVEGIAHFAESMASAAEKVQHLADEFGLTTAQVQGLQGVALGTGTSIDTLTRGMGLLDKNTATASGSTSAVGKALKLVGVSADDGRTQMERLSIVADKFNSLPKGPERLALAMVLFGRSGKEMIPILEQGSKGIEELTAKAKDFGMISDDAEGKGLKLAEAVNTSKMAWEGLKTTLMDALAPLLTQMAEGFQNLVKEMTESYNAGGPVRDVFEALSTIFQGLGAIVTALSETIHFLYQNMSILLPVVAGLAAAFTAKYVVGALAAGAATSELRGAMSLLMVVMKSEGVVEALSLAISGLRAGLIAATAATLEFSMALLACPFTWLAAAVAGAIALYREWTGVTKEQKDATDDLATAEQGLADAEGNLADKSREALEAMRAEEAQALNLAEAHLKAASAALAHAQAEAAVAKQRVDLASKIDPGAGVSSGTYLLSLFASHNVDKQKKAVDDDKKAVDDLQQSLAKLDEAIKKAPSHTNNDLGLGHTPKAKKEKHPKEKKPKDTTEALADEQLSMAEKEALAEIKIAEDKNNSLYQLGQRTLGDFVAQQLALEDAKYKAVQDFYTKKAAADAKDVVKHQKDLDDLKLAEIAHTEAVARINEQAAEKRNQQAKKETSDYIKELEDQLKVDIAGVGERYKLHEITLKQKIQLEKDLTSVVEREVLARLQAEINSYAKDTDQYRATVKAKEDAERKFTADKKKMDDDLLNTERQKYQQMFQPFADSLAKMLTAQQGFMASMKSMWNSLQSIAEHAISNIVRNWLVGLATKEAASKIANQKEVFADAKVAAANAYKWAASWGGPPAGAIAAGIAFASVEAYSAEGGDWNVKPGLYELHKDEMVLPAWAASPLRNMIQGGSGSASPAFAANDSSGGGDMHLHLHGDLIHNPRQLEAWFKANKSAVGAGVKQYARMGGRG